VADAVAERSFGQLAHPVFVHQVDTNAFNRVFADDLATQLVRIL